MQDKINNIHVTRPTVPIAHLRTYTNRFHAANDDGMSLWQLLKLIMNQIKKLNIPGQDN